MTIWLIILICVKHTYYKIKFSSQNIYTSGKYSTICLHLVHYDRKLEVYKYFVLFFDHIVHDCGRLIIPNANFTSPMTTTFDTRVQFECLEGYISGGTENEAKCGGDSLWQFEPCEGMFQLQFY